MAILCDSIGLLYIQVPATGCSVVSSVLKQEHAGIQLGRKHNDLSEVVQKKLISKSQLEDLIVIANVRSPYDRLTTYFQRHKGGWAIETKLRVQSRMLEKQIEAGELTLKQQRESKKKLDRARVRTERQFRRFRYVGFNQWLWLTLMRWSLQDRGDDRDSEKRNRMFPMLDGVDLVLPQENLEASLNQALACLGVASPISLPRKNLTQDKKPYQSYYNRSSLWLLQSLYGQEIKRFGYEFGHDSKKEQLLALTPKGSEHIS